LQFSVHESTDDARDKLIPFKSKLTLEQISQEGELWHAATGRQPFFNYCAHADNTSDDDAARIYGMFNPAIWQATISEGSRKIHGISDDMVASQPTFSDTSKRLADYLRNRVIVTYNGTRFDIPVLQAEFDRAGVPMPPIVAIDLYRHVRNRYDRPIRPASKQLGDQCLFFEVKLEKAHRAADDAEATGRLLIAMQDRGLIPRGVDSLVGM
jgi:DNA polymerase III epsilon subunit-like protein